MKRSYGERSFFKTKVSVAVVVAGLASAACSASVNANNQSVESCTSGAAQFDGAAKGYDVPNAEDLAAEERDVVTLLWQRTEKAGGHVSFGDNETLGASLEATKTNLSINVSTESSWAATKDTLVFGIQDGRAVPLAIGTVVCGGNNGLVAKQIVPDLNQLANETLALPPQ